MEDSVSSHPRSLNVILNEIRKLVCGTMHVFGLYYIRNYCVIIL